MMELTFVKLEDNRECIILNEIFYNDTKYVFLVNSLDKDDFIIRKVLENKLVGIENENELKEIFNRYLENRFRVKNKNE